MPAEPAAAQAAPEEPREAAPPVGGHPTGLAPAAAGRLHLARQPRTGVRQRRPVIRVVPVRLHASAVRFARADDDDGTGRRPAAGPPFHGAGGGDERGGATRQALLAGRPQRARCTARRRRHWLRLRRPRRRPPLRCRRWRPPAPDQPRSARHRGGEDPQEPAGQHEGGQPLSELLTRLQASSGGGGRRRRRDE